MLKRVENEKLKSVEFDSYGNLALGQTDTFDIITDPSNYPLRKLKFSSSKKEVVEVDGEGNVKALAKGSSIIRVEDELTGLKDEVMIIVGNGNGSNDEKKEVIEENKNTEKKEDEEKMTEEKKVVRRATKKEVKKKKYSDKSYTKEELVDNLAEQTEGFSKRELNELVTLVDSLRADALDEGKELQFADIKFSRKEVKGRVYKANKNINNNEINPRDTFVPGHVVMTARKAVDRESLKGKILDSGKFQDEKGKIHEVK